MIHVQAMTKEYFIKRLADLCLRSGLSGFPKDEAVDQIDVVEVIRTGREEIARRKREYMERASMQAKKR